MVPSLQEILNNISGDLQLDPSKLRKAYMPPFAEFYNFRDGVKMSESTYITRSVPVLCKYACSCRPV